ncbi:GNAT family N-acetyltransferase [Clostridium subterminale]|uniref:GNAT family N-acetyltransferase n=1 Tax=Clostridium subterminale TaxID=1550 RepID=A0ABP3VSR3_CLOSU
MELYEIKESTKDEEDLVWKGIIQYNSAVIHLKQIASEIPVNRVSKEKDGNVIGDINCILFYCWNTLYIDMLWIRENHRKSGHGSKLLNEVERIAREEKCTLIHLETMDFQAKDFYIKNGYEIFGELENVPNGHKRYYMRKIL